MGPKVVRDVFAAIEPEAAIRANVNRLPPPHTSCGHVASLLRVNGNEPVALDAHCVPRHGRL